MKKYYLMYNTITGTPYTLKFDTLFDFSAALDKAQENVFIVQQSIEFKTVGS